jgi:diketogulonate reductase-like aldo/keto reductase
VLLRWGLQRCCAVIPKSVNPERVALFAPSQLADWQLNSHQLAELDALQDGTKYCWDASGVT